MGTLAAIAGALLLTIVLWEGFETIVLPRRVTRKIRLTRLFYRTSWRVWSALFGRVAKRSRRDQLLSVFGPLSMLFLLSFWAAGLVLGFSLLDWGAGARMKPQTGPVNFWTVLYMSGTTFFTLGLGDVTPVNAVGRFITVLEGGMGFGFLALVIGYLPVLYQSFSQREINITLLDARAGTPATAAEMMRRHAHARSLPDLDRLFHEWERWSAELLESHISYPVLSYYRSQHDNQSWLGSLSTILDCCALVLAGTAGPSRWQAQLTFAMSRHAVVDLAQVLNTAPVSGDPGRLPPAGCKQLWDHLRAAGIQVPPLAEFEPRLAALRRMYEPYIHSLAAYLLIAIPGWMRSADTLDNWRTSAWERSSAGLVFDEREDEHAR